MYTIYFAVSVLNKWNNVLFVINGKFNLVINRFTCAIEPKYICNTIISRMNLMNFCCKKPA